MSAWRAKAIELFPELKRDIETSLNPMELWCVLFSVFKSGLENGEYDESIKVSSYAEWCITSTSSSDLVGPHQATLMGFYESIARDKAIWRHLSNVIPEKQFQRNIGTFRYCLNEEEIAYMKKCFYHA